MTKESQTGQATVPLTTNTFSFNKIKQCIITYDILNNNKSIIPRKLQSDIHCSCKIQKLYEQSAET